MDKYTIAPPAGSTNNSVGAEDRPWHEGHFDALKLGGGDLGEYLAESTGYGIVSGCEPTISGLTVTVAAGVVHLADGTRKEISASNITLDSADSTNPRIDLVYINSDGVVSKSTGIPGGNTIENLNLPDGAIVIAHVRVLANATEGVIFSDYMQKLHDYNDDYVEIQDSIKDKLYLSHGGWGYRQGYCMEDSMKAMVNSVENGFDGTEIDLRLDKDGVIVIAHNDAISGTWKALVNGEYVTTGNVADYSHDQLYFVHPLNPAEVTAEKMSTLEDVVKYYSRTNKLLAFDIKVDISRHRIAEICETYGLKKYAFLAYNQAELQRSYAAGDDALVFVSPWDGTTEGDILTDDFINILKSYNTERIAVNFGVLSHSSPTYETNLAKVKRIGADIWDGLWSRSNKTLLDTITNNTKYILSDYRESVVENKGDGYTNDSGWTLAVPLANAEQVTGASEKLRIRKIDNMLYVYGALTVTFTSNNQELVNFRQTYAPVSRDSGISVIGVIPCAAVSNNEQCLAWITITSVPRIVLNAIYALNGSGAKSADGTTKYILRFSNVVALGQGYNENE